MGVARMLGMIVAREAVRMPDIFPSINAVIGFMRAEGYTYRYQEMRRDIANMIEVRDKFDIGGVDPRNAIVSPDRMPKVWWNAEARYRQFGRAWYKDSETGEDYWRLVSYYTDINQEGYLEDSEYANLFGEERYGKSQVFLRFDKLGTWARRGPTKVGGLAGRDITSVQAEYLTMLNQ